MSRLIETIMLRDGIFENLPYHQTRLNHSFNTLFGATGGHDLERLLSRTDTPPAGLFKCRVVYDRESWSVEITPYEPRTVTSLKLLCEDAITYDHKFEDRTPLTDLFARRGSCDDILIIKKNLVTDSFIANIAFRRGNEWITPESCLLKGTMRQSLIDNEIIRVEAIRKDDIRSFQSFRLINAMIGFDGPETDIKNIIF